MYGTAVWLIWVFSLQAGSQSLLFLLIATVIFAFGLWAIGAAQGAHNNWALAGRIVGVVAILVAIGYVISLTSREPVATAPSGAVAAGLTYAALIALKSSFAPIALLHFPLAVTVVAVKVGDAEKVGLV